MTARIGFLLFLIGLFLGSVLPRFTDPPKKQLGVRVDCAPAVAL